MGSGDFKTFLTSMDALLGYQLPLLQDICTVEKCFANLQKGAKGDAHADSESNDDDANTNLGGMTSYMMKKNREIAAKANKQPVANPVHTSPTRIIDLW